MNKTLEREFELTVHLKAWRRYEKTRLTGLFNMLDKRNVMAHANLTADEYHFILFNYIDLKDLYAHLAHQAQYPNGKTLAKHISLEAQISFIENRLRISPTDFDKDHYNAILATLSRLPKGVD